MKVFSLLNERPYLQAAQRINRESVTRQAWRHPSSQTEILTMGDKRSQTPFSMAMSAKALKPKLDAPSRLSAPPELADSLAVLNGKTAD